MDPHAVTELTLFIENDGELYKSRGQPIIANLAKKVAKGTYDAALAEKMYGYLAEDGARKYAWEFGARKPGTRSWREQSASGNGMFDTATRRAVARNLRVGYDEDVRSAAREIKPSTRKRNPGLVTSAAGKQRQVKNLGWFDRYASKNIIDKIVFTPSGIGGLMTARFQDGTLFTAEWADASVFAEWLKRPLLRGVNVVYSRKNAGTMRRRNSDRAELFYAHNLHTMTAKPTMAQVKMYNAEYNQHLGRDSYFARGTSRFFGGDKFWGPYRGPGGLYFVQQNNAGIKIKKVGPMGQISTGAPGQTFGWPEDARAYAKALAQGAVERSNPRRRR